MSYYLGNSADSDEDLGELGAPPRCGVLERRVRGQCVPKPSAAIQRITQQAANAAARNPANARAQAVLSAAQAAGVPIPAPRLPAGVAPRPGRRCPPSQQWSPRDNRCMTPAEKKAARKARTKGGHVVDEKDVNPANAVLDDKASKQRQKISLAQQIIAKLTSKRGRLSKREKAKLAQMQRIVSSGGALSGLGACCVGNLPVIGYMQGGIGQDEDGAVKDPCEGGGNPALKNLISQMAASPAIQLPRQCQRYPQRPICLFANMAQDSRKALAAALQAIVDLECQIAALKAEKDRPPDMCPAGYQFDVNGECVPIGTGGGGITQPDGSMTFTPDYGGGAPPGYQPQPQGPFPSGGDDSMYIDQGPVATPGQAPPSTAVPGGGSVAPGYVTEESVVQDEGGEVPTQRTFATPGAPAAATGLPVVPLDEGAETDEPAWGAEEGESEEKGAPAPWGGGSEYATEEALVE